ncbi:MAG TPA: trehalose-6-phosphate synthase [Longimicrobiales bacterium]|nr:trehalose-6-phosphate synthase [Longimicrobiales bacterium]
MPAKDPGAARTLDAAGLGPVFRDAFPRRRFVVASNREPYEHVWDEQGEDLVVRRPAGGLVAALDPLMQAVGGTWVAWGSGDRDRDAVDEFDRVRVPPEDPAYTLHRLWLSQQDVHQYYYGYSNQFLWPLCHLRPALTRARGKYWDRYTTVNARFGEAVLKAVEGRDDSAAVWFQDYHLALAPGWVRQRRPDLTLAHFWHIPFPPLEIFRVASQGEELLRGLLANDVMGFHLPLFCDNFLRCAESLVPGVRVDWENRLAELDGHRCYVRAFPISIDIDAMRGAAARPGAAEREARLRQRYVADGGVLGIGVDRIDYSKGLEEKLTALDMFFERHPEFRERFTYVQIATPSRTGIDAYDWLNEKLERQAWRLNDRYGTDSWQPVHLLKESLPWERLAVYYRAADLCFVNSLQDGMNLVAKEYVACQVDRPGVLVLSKFAGAAEELDGAYEVNPFDPEATAEALRTVLLMSAEERRDRMDRLTLSLRSIYDWMAEIFRVWSAVSRGEAAPLSAADHWSRSR